LVCSTGGDVSPRAVHALAWKYKAPEVLTTPGASFLGSGGGIRGRAALASATKRSFVANPRPPGYEKVSAFSKRTETTQSYRLTRFSGCAGWGSLVQSDPRVTPPSHRNWLAISVAFWCRAVQGKEETRRCGPLGHESRKEAERPLTCSWPWSHEGRER
jgi:hypothetical protein